MNNQERIKLTLDAIESVKAQLKAANSPLDEIDAYDRLQTLYVVLEEECELALDMLFNKIA